jgi:hypothetical protein
MGLSQTPLKIVLGVGEATVVDREHCAQDGCRGSEIVRAQFVREPNQLRQPFPGRVERSLRDVQTRDPECGVRVESTRADVLKDACRFGPVLAGAVAEAAALLGVAAGNEGERSREVVGGGACRRDGGQSMAAGTFDVPVLEAVGRPVHLEDRSVPVELGALDALRADAKSSATSSCPSAWRGAVRSRAPGQRVRGSSPHAMPS